MQKATAFSLFFLVLLVLASCVERFNPVIDDLNSFVIIDGMFTDQDGPHRVKLNIASGLSRADNKPLEAAIVVIRSDDGEEESLIEVEPGIYQTKTIGYKGIADRSYQLAIESRGKRYESSYQKLNATSPSKNLYGEIEYQYSIADQAEVPGYQFYTDGPDVRDRDTYLLWLQEATFKYRADYPIDFSYSGFLAPFPNQDSLSTCYRTDNIDNIATFSSEAFSGSVADRIALNFQRADLEPLSIRYSLLSRQYSIDKEAYNFWNALSAQLASSSDLYTTQPYQIRSNVYNIDDADETVLGYFTVGGLTEKRIFVNKPTVPIPEKVPCFLDYEAFGYIFVYGPSAWPVFVTAGEEGNALAAPGCMDCRELGGAIFKPEFWEE